MRSYPTIVVEAPLWLHAVSVGEVNAAAPLVTRLLRDHPGLVAGHHHHHPLVPERVRCGDAGGAYPPVFTTRPARSRVSSISGRPGADRETEL